MKRFFTAILLLLVASVWAQAQTQNPFNRYVAFDPPGRSRLYFGIGDEIYLKIDDDKTFTPWVITSVTDSGFVVEGRHLRHEMIAARYRRTISRLLDA